MWESMSPREREIVMVALNHHLRYFRNLLDRAKEDDAVDRQSNNCVEVKKVIDKLRPTPAAG